jgi:co-chaperonin GroES (HSP10)
MSFYPGVPPSSLTTLFRLQKTATGIFLPTSATTNPLPEATVIAVGPGATNKDGQVVPTQVKAGDRVLLPGWGGNSIKVGEEVRVNRFPPELY